MFLQRRAKAILLALIVVATTTRCFSEWILTPLAFSPVSVYRVPLITLEMAMGGLDSHLLIVQQGFMRPPSEGFPNYDTSGIAEFDDADSGLNVIADWHPCNPHLFDGPPIDVTGGGAGCVDLNTSGGAIHFLPANGEERDAVEVSWVLVGTTAGSCSIEMEKLLANDGVMLRAVQTLHDKLALEFEEMPLVEANIKTIEDGKVSLVDQKGATLAVASPGDLEWVRRIKAAFRDSYSTEPTASGAAGRRVTYLMLDYILRSPEFQNEVQFVAKRQAA